MCFNCAESSTIEQQLNSKRQLRATWIIYVKLGTTWTMMTNHWERCFLYLVIKHLLLYEVMGLRLGELLSSLFQIRIYHYCILNIILIPTISLFTTPQQRQYSQQMDMIQKSQLDTMHTLADSEEPRPSRYICYSSCFC